MVKRLDKKDILINNSYQENRLINKSFEKDKLINRLINSLNIKAIATQKQKDLVEAAAISISVYKNKQYALNLLTISNYIYHIVIKMDDEINSLYLDILKLIE